MRESFTAALIAVSVLAPVTVANSASANDLSNNPTTTCPAHTGVHQKTPALSKTGDSSSDKDIVDHVKSLINNGLSRTKTSKANLDFTAAQVYKIKSEHSALRFVTIPSGKKDCSTQVESPSSSTTATKF